MKRGNLRLLFRRNFAANGLPKSGRHLCASSNSAPSAERFAWIPFPLSEKNSASGSEAIAEPEEKLHRELPFCGPEASAVHSGHWHHRAR